MINNVFWNIVGGGGQWGGLLKTENHLWQPRIRGLILCKCKRSCPSRNILPISHLVDCVWNVMAHTQKPDFVFRRKRRIHLNRLGRQFSRLLTAERCASTLVMPGTPSSEVVWRVLATHSIRQFSLHFPFRASPCAITFQRDSTFSWRQRGRNLKLVTLLRLVSIIGIK